MSAVIRCLVATAIFAAATTAAGQGGRPGGGGFGQPGQFPGGAGGGQQRRGGGMRDAGPPVAGTGVLRGRVVGGDTGGPLRRALVRLTGQEIREGKMTTTDEQGRWEIHDLPVGRFNLTASKAGYVTLQFGQRRPFEQGRPIDLADGQSLDNVNFNLPRGSVIAGRINDEYGDPVAEASVTAMRYRFFNGQRRLIPVGRFSQTDDGGNFRIYGLAPGDYYLTATLRTGMGMFADNDPSSRQSYSPTYYPGTGSAQQAERVTVGLGAEVDGVTFALQPVRTIKVSGTALDSQGRPMTGAMVQIVEDSSDGENMMMSRSFGPNNRVDGAGRFSIANVAPGEYTLMASEMRPPGEGADPEVAQAKITTGSEDLTGVTLIGSRGVIIRGTVAFDSQQSGGGGAKLSSVSLTAVPRNANATPAFRFGPGMRDTVNDDGTFELRASSTPVLIRTMRAPQGFLLKAVIAGGQDVTDSGVAFKSGETVTGVQVVLTSRSTAISGTVTDSKGDPASDYAVVVFAEDSAKWGFMSRYISMARPDQQGAFQVKQLPPAQYLVVAVPYLEDGEQTNPETLERLRPLATGLDLAEGDQKTLALKLTPNY